MAIALSREMKIQAFFIIGIILCLMLRMVEYYYDHRVVKNYSQNTPVFTQGMTKFTTNLNLTSIIVDGEPGSDKCECGRLAASDIFSGNLRVSQDDPDLLGFVKKYVLTPPSPLAYNLTDPTGHHFTPIESVQKYVMSLLGNNRHGVYVECCGSNDGEGSSNTLVLERDYGWSGLIIEEDPQNAEKLLKKRRKAWVANACAGIHPFPYEIETYRHTDTQLRPHLADYGFCSNGPEEECSKTLVKVRCLPLYTIMAALDLQDLDYMSMGDIDGVELKVLNTLPFDKIKVKVFSIETMPKNSEAVRAFMHSKGYAFVKTFAEKYGGYDVFAHKSLLKDTLEDVVLEANPI